MSCYIDLLFNEYFIYSFVKCESKKSLSVMWKIQRLTCIVTKMYLEEDIIVLITDCNKDMIEEDKKYLTELIKPLKNVSSIKHKVKKQEQDD